MKKLLSLILVMALSVSLFAGCNETDTPATETTNEDNATEGTTNDTGETDVEETADPVEVVFAFAGGDPLIKQLTSERVQKFNSEQSQFIIKEQPSGSGTYLDFLKTQDAIGEFPDFLDSRDTQVWVDADKFAELPESVIPLVKNIPEYNGKKYALPISTNLPSVGMYYNKDIFDELGLEEPKTWAEFEALCDEISAAGIAPIVQGGKDIWHMGFLWSQFWIEKVFADNPNWIADKRAGTVSFTDPNVQEMITKYASMYEDGYFEKGWLSTADNQIVSFMMAEKAAMFFSGSWMITQVSEADPEFNLGWFPLPDEDGDLNLVYGDTLAGFALSKEASQDPGKVAAFEAFMNFWYEDENYVPYVETIVAAPSSASDPDVVYESELPNEFATALEEAEVTDLFWNNKWGDNMLPGGFRNFAYKAFQEMVGTGSSAMELGELLDKQWDVEISQTE